MPVCGGKSSPPGERGQFSVNRAYKTWGEARLQRKIAFARGRTPFCSRNRPSPRGATSFCSEKCRKKPGQSHFAAQHRVAPRGKATSPRKMRRPRRPSGFCSKKWRRPEWGARLPVGKTASHRWGPPLPRGKATSHQWEPPLPRGKSTSHRWEPPLPQGKTTSHRWGRPLPFGKTSSHWWERVQRQIPSTGRPPSDPAHPRTTSVQGTTIKKIPCRGRPPCLPLLNKVKHKTKETRSTLFRDEPCGDHSAWHVDLDPTQKRAVVEPRRSVLCLHENFNSVFQLLVDTLFGTVH